MEAIEFSQSEIPAIAKELLKHSSSNVWLFHADMGAGKTTIIKAICKELGVTENISSPTYSIVNEYHSSNDQVIYHFDFYRIQEEEEALDIGTEEYLDSGALCLIEWPNKIDSLLPENTMNIHIQVKDNDLREITIKKGAL